MSDGAATLLHPQAGVPAWVLEPAFSVESLDAEACAVALAQARAAEQAAAYAQLVVAAPFAELHREARTRDTEVDADAPVLRHLFGEHLVALAGPGAPQVAELAPAELAATIDVSDHVAEALLGDALELKHRLPRLWAVLGSAVGRRLVPVGRARGAAAGTRGLTPQQADGVDVQLTGRLRDLTVRRARVLADEAIPREDPDRAHEWEREALERRGVWLHDVDQHDPRAPVTMAAVQVEMVLDRIDAYRFDTVLNDLAHELGTLGDTRDRDVRRAAGVGLLADPQRALALLGGSATPDHERASLAPRGGTLPRAVPHLHLDAGMLLEPDASPAVLTEQATALSGGLLADWRSRTDAVVVPVLPGRRLSPEDDRPVVPSRPADRPRPPGQGGRSRPRPGCGRKCCCATRRASPPPAPETPAAATSTASTSSPTSRSTRTALPPRRARTTWLPCADGTTASRPTWTGPTRAFRAVAAPGPTPSATSSTSSRLVAATDARPTPAPQVSIDSWSTS